MGPIDWPAVYAEALETFVQYLRIPSVNRTLVVAGVAGPPPGTLL